MRFQIGIILFVFALIPTLIMKTVLINTCHDETVEMRTAEIQNQSTILCAQLGGEDLLTEISSEDFQSKITELARVYDARIVIVNRDYQVLFDSFGISQGKILLSSNAVHAFDGVAEATYEQVDNVIISAIPIESTINGSVVGVMLVSSSTDILLDYEEEMNRISTVVLCALLVVMLLVTFPIGIMVSRPLRKISEYMRELYYGHTTDAMNVGPYTEAKEISQSFNQLFRRMKSIDDSRQEFVANVSHELKTPLTSLKILSDSLIYQEHVPEELYKEFLQDMSEEVDRENKIINDLLELVKMDRKADVLKIQKENINLLVENILWRLKPIAKKQSVELVFESMKPVVAEVDESKLSLALMNLIENAIKYNQTNGWVHVTVDADQRFFMVEVADSGIGIAKEDQEHIFDRFYRVDKSHSREIGGTGLGLAIARNAILMHRGTVQIVSEEGKGTTFTVRIPLNYIKS